MTPGLQPRSHVPVVRSTRVGHPAEYV